MKIAIVCASGMGDALIMQSIAHLLTKRGWKTTTFSDHLAGFGKWLPGFRFAKQPSLAEIPTVLTSYDAIFLQHDNTPKACAIKEIPLPIYTFYGSYHSAKHGSFCEERDYVCNRSKSMVYNLNLAAQKLFREKIYENGLRAPSHLLYRRFPKRIAIHPTSREEARIWPQAKFLKVAEYIENAGYEPYFLVSPQESAAWPKVAPCATFEDLASFLYESGAFLGNDSGPAHLASYLHIPHLVIGGNGLQMPLWRTGWLQGELLLPPSFVTYFKILRPYWKYFISTKNVIKKLNNSILRN